MQRVCFSVTLPDLFQYSNLACKTGIVHNTHFELLAILWIFSGLLKPHKENFIDRKLEHYYAESDDV